MTVIHYKVIQNWTALVLLHCRDNLLSIHAINNERENTYSRTSVARTLMARLPRLFGTRS